MNSTLLRHHVVCSATARHLFLLQTLMNSVCRLAGQDLLQMKLLFIFRLQLHVQLQLNKLNVLLFLAIFVRDSYSTYMPLQVQLNADKCNSYFYSLPQILKYRCSKTLCFEQ